MLEPWIVEEILRREQEKEERRIPLEAPVYQDPIQDTEASPPTDADRGVIIIDL